MRSSRWTIWSTDLVQQVAVVADQQDRVRIALAGNPPATASLRGRDGWSARPAAAGRARRTARRPAPRACASRRRNRCTAAPAPSASKPRPGRIWRRAPARHGRRCRAAADGSRRCGAGRWRVSASASSAARSVSAASTVSSRLCGPPGASCATHADAGAVGQRISPPSAWISPAISFSSVDLPVPLRPTSPALWPVGSVRLAPSSKGRPAMR